MGPEFGLRQGVVLHQIVRFHPHVAQRYPRLPDQQHTGAEEHSAAGQGQPREQPGRRLEKLRFLDPSCGCGNFLIVTYRELRLLEQGILERQFAAQVATGQTVDLALHARVQVD